MNSSSPDSTPAASAFHAGIVCIVGRANTGKSSFLNAALGEKVAAVSPVAQTTRRTTRGIYNAPSLQMVFLDTPGIRHATHRLGALLNRNARAQVAGSDVVCLLLDASLPPQDEDIGWMRKLARDPIPVFALLNKTDLPHRDAPYRAAWAAVVDDLRARDAAYVPPPIDWFPVSALTGEGLPELLDALSMRMPAAAPLFDPDVLTDDPLPFFIADIIRAHFNEHLRKELPHAIAIAVDALGPAPASDVPPPPADDAPPADAEAPTPAPPEAESPETSDNAPLPSPAPAASSVLHVSATIYVEKATQRPILLGHKGRLLRSVRIASERELHDILGTPCKLALWIKVEPDWSKNYWILKKLGYVGS